METLLLLLAFPIAWPFIAKHFWHNEINWTEMVLQLVICIGLVCAVWFSGMKGQTDDTEIWNGFITNKERVHGQYTLAYPCNCTTDSQGMTSCQTCWEDRYTVTWYADSTIGKIIFDKLDKGSRIVYKAPDPAAYINCIVGEPASLEKRYTNYVQAVPQSLFHDDAALETYAHKVPAYPRVYDFYKINRVLNVDSTVGEDIIQPMNKLFNEKLKFIGPTKEVNIVVILTEIDDPTYRYAVENKWFGGEKNDVIVIVGLDGHNITWSDTITWALNKNNELLSVTLRDAVQDLKVLETKPFVETVTKTVDNLYDRPSMADFEYLKDEITPPQWAIITAALIAILGSLLLSLIFYIYEVDDFIGDVILRRF